MPSCCAALRVLTESKHRSHFLMLPMLSYPDRRFLEDDGSRDLMELAREMEEVSNTNSWF